MSALHFATALRGANVPRAALRLALTLCLALGVAALGRNLADRVGTSLGRGAARLVAPLGPSLARAAERDAASSAEATTEAVGAEAVPPEAEEGRRPVEASRSRRGRGSRPDAAPARSTTVVVSAQRVLALANSGARPSAVPIGPRGSRPGGLRLVGVSGLGVGMRDGDVLTRVQGAPTPSVSTVVDRVLQARARQLPHVSAEFWRDGTRHTLVVEQPYVAEPNAARELALTPRSARPKLRSP